MDLKDFTKQAILQIVSGVSEANDELLKMDASIPTYNVRNSTRYIDEEQGAYRDVIDVDFDVAITASETIEKGGGFGLNVVSIVAGGKVESTKENQSISRIKFTLPLVLPKIGKQVKRVPSVSAF